MIFQNQNIYKKWLDETFQRLEKSILKFINETNFKRFTMIIKSAGFIDSKFISSQNALDFAYAIIKKIKKRGHYVGTKSWNFCPLLPVVS